MIRSQVVAHNGRTILWLDEDTIRDAGFDTTNITQKQFNQIASRLEKYMDAHYQSLVFEMSQDLLPLAKNSGGDLGA